MLSAAYENKHKLQHCLEWNTRVSGAYATPDSVVTYLFHDLYTSLLRDCIVWNVCSSKS